MSDSTSLPVDLSTETDDASSSAAVRKRNAERALGITVPVLTVIVLVLLWQILVVGADIPQYILPSPIAVAKALVSDWGILWPALWVTTQITFISLVLALIGGVGFAIFLVQSRWIELAFYPLAVILQVTPIVAIAPLILI